MTQKYYLGVDVGSASVRAGIFNAKGQRLSFAVEEIDQYHPKTNFVEQSSSNIWKKVCVATRTAIAESGVPTENICSLGFDATCSLVACDERGIGVSVSQNGEPDRDVIMWMDHRASDEAEKINATGHHALRYVGGEVSVEMQLPKVFWLRKNFPDRYERIWRFFDLADYLVWRATGVDAASVCTLTCKWNYLAHENKMPSDLLDLIGLRDLLPKIPPRVMQLGEAAGRVSADAAKQLGLTEQVVVASGVIDAHAGGIALIGGDPEGGLALISGTSNCHMVVSAEPVMVPGVWGPYLNAMLPNWWLSEGGQSAAGALVDWTVSQCGFWPELLQQAKERDTHPFSLLNDWVKDLQKVDQYPTRDLHVLGDHHGNRSPRANPNARGLVSGLTLETGPDFLARMYLATLQAVAYGTRHIVDEMTAAGHEISKVYICGGATKNPVWLQEYANITGRDIQLAAEEDMVTLGAAILGAVAAERFPSIHAACTALVRPGKRIQCDPQTRAFHDAKYEVYLKLYDEREHHKEIMGQWA
ncbi:FGGY-family carbohydrate kinase [Pseudovibrio exalbescens]|uniref:FGGY-family carbohydrate kinase n=1 Tax=Pseudovibrio exalbescens TaxID=197461 RepID=UPI000C9BDA2B|nr:FGGY-family carbohydrate kinase [Pseudovibrio exalbescens]